MIEIIYFGIVVIAAMAGVICFLIWYSKKAEKNIYRRVLISNMGKRFPDYYDEFTDEIADLMLEARESYEVEWKKKHVKKEAIVKNDTPLVSFLQPYLSKELYTHIESDPIQDQILRTAIFDSIMVSGDAKLRTWVDRDGKVQNSIHNERPPAWW